MLRPKRIIIHQQGIWSDRTPTLMHKMRLSPTHHLSFSPAEWRRLREGGGVQPERSDACNDNAASLTWIALHQLLIAAPDILVVCLSNVSLFLSGGPRPTHQIRGNCWGQGLTQYTLQSEGGLETNLINGGYSPSYLDGANKKKQTNGLQRPSREESCGPLSSKLDPFRRLSTRLPGRHQT